MSQLPSELLPGTIVGRYQILTEIASGGMATVYLARAKGAAGFSRLVALKRPHRHVTQDPQSLAMFMDEARLAAWIHDPHVVSTLDLGYIEGELYLAMEFIEGDGLNGLLTNAQEQQRQVPLGITLQVMSDVLIGLHTAHELCDESGAPLNLVHRDVSPHNILVGVDGLARITDFGIAHARARMGSDTLRGQIKGKFAYMAPEQLSGGKLDRRVDIFACGLVLWECLASRRVFHSPHGEMALISSILLEPLPNLKDFRADLPEPLYAIVARALEKDPSARFSSCLEFFEAIETLRQVGIPFSSAREVGQWVRELSGEHIERLRRAISGDPKAQGSAPPRREPGTPSAKSSTGSRAQSSKSDYYVKYARYEAPPQAEGPETVELPPSENPTTHELDAPSAWDESTVPFMEEAPNDSLSTLRPEVSRPTLKEDPLSFFGLSAAPFREVRLPQFFFRQGPYQEASEALSQALSAPHHPLLLLGDQGCGKTFLVESFCRKEPQFYHLSLEPSLLFGLSPLEALCRQLSLSPAGLSSYELFGLFVKALRGARPDAALVLLTFDGCSEQDVEPVRELLTLIQDAKAPIKILLTGEQSLPQRLVSAGYKGLLSPHVKPVLLRPMSPQEMLLYIKLRFEVALEGDFAVDLPPAAASFLHTRSKGLPRVINAYMHNAMLMAYLRRSRTFTVDILRLAMKSRSYLSLEEAKNIFQSDQRGA